jgi:predicted RNA-binding Zn-ribbon protein involved in translation (DUF1610 family)
MFSFVKRLFRQLIRRSTHIQHESINKSSIIILILVDIFVLFNVFNGLNNIAQLPLSPQEEFPCFSAYEHYQADKQKGTFDFNTATIESIIDVDYKSPSFLDDKQRSRLGKVSGLCENVSRLSKQINTTENIKLKTSINQDRTLISRLNQETETLRRQYDSTLLEKIAGQSSQKSINQASADQVKPKIDANNAEIAVQKKLILEKQTKLVQQPSSQEYLKRLNDASDYKEIQKAYRSAQFWHPNKQLFLQTAFLLPLIALAYFVNTAASKKNKGVIALISWHLLVIFCIPLLIKFFEFVQFGNLLGVVIEGLTTLLGGLLFITSYLLILIIPLAGFGLIKFLQKFVFNPKVQARNRIQNVRCINCNFKLGVGDEFCPSCGFNQFVDCSNCHQKTYKFTSFCKHCGHDLAQTPNLNSPL